LDLQKENVSTIIWTTGFTTDHSYIKLPVFNENGSPLHKDGSSPVDGLYFMGLHFLRTRKSAIIFGIKEDAEFIASNVVRFARGEKANIQPIS
jgi:putative flavoprotein involved in K+ transport